MGDTYSIYKTPDFSTQSLNKTHTLHSLQFLYFFAFQSCLSLSRPVAYQHLQATDQCRNAMHLLRHRHSFTGFQISLVGIYDATWNHVTFLHSVANYNHPDSLRDENIIIQWIPQLTPKSRIWSIATKANPYLLRKPNRWVNIACNMLEFGLRQWAGLIFL